MDSARAPVRSVASDDRAVATVGRHAKLELIFGRRGDRTVLKHSYAEPPFRVGRVLPDGDGLHLILASSAPGIFGGDCLRQTVVVEAGARVRLTSQSATQVHASEAGTAASLWSSYRVEDRGRLECTWDPLIPFTDARLDQRIQIALGGAATLAWSDALMAGREARGERWRFARLSHELRLERAERLAYMERYTISGGGEAPVQRWTGDTACYFGTVLAANETVDRGLAAHLHDWFATHGGVRGSADALAEGLLLARLTATDGVAFHAARAFVANALNGTA